MLSYKEAYMKVRVELEMEIDMTELSIAEVRRIIDQLVSADETRVVKGTKVTDFEILE
jgi:hypothetical protein